MPTAKKKAPAKTSRQKREAVPKAIAEAQKGRPTDYSDDLADLICARIATGESMRSVARDENMPSAVTMFSWFRKHEYFLKQYTRAKEESADAWADEVVDIPDNQTGNPLILDGVPMLDPETGRPIMVVDAAAVQHAKLRVEARKWSASKLKPKKYGEKLDLSSNDGSMTPRLIKRVIIKRPEPKR